MSAWYVECRSVSTGGVAFDIADHLSKQHLTGQTLIITKDPPVLPGVMRKYWLRKMQAIKRAQASTLDITKHQMLKQRLHNMERLRFDATVLGNPDADVRVVTYSTLFDNSMHYTYTMAYLTYSLPSNELGEVVKTLANNNVRLVDYCGNIVRVEEGTAAVIFINEPPSGPKLRQILGAAIGERG